MGTSHGSLLHGLRGWQIMRRLKKHNAVSCPARDDPGESRWVEVVEAPIGTVHPRLLTGMIGGGVVDSPDKGEIST